MQRLQLRGERVKKLRRILDWKGNGHSFEHQGNGVSRELRLGGKEDVADGVLGGQARVGAAPW